MTLHRQTFVRRPLAVVLVALFSFFSASCVIFGTPPGESCETTGDGFTRQDPCSTDCMDYAGTCPDGRTVTPNQCTFSECTADGGECESGQVCVLTGTTDGLCVDASACP